MIIIEISHGILKILYMIIFMSVDNQEVINEKSKEKLSCLRRTLIILFENVKMFFR